MDKHYNRRTVVIILSVLLLIGAIFLARWIIHSILYISTDDAQIKGNLVGVSSKVAARIIHLGVEEGDLVKKGQVISRLDDRDLKASYDQAVAAAESARIDEDRYARELAIRDRETALKVGMASNTLDSSRDRLDISRQDLAMEEETTLADLKRQAASLAAAKAYYSQSEAEYTQAKDDAVRADKLYRQGFISQQQDEQAKIKSITAKDRVQAAKENITQQARILDITRSHLRSTSIKKSQYEAARNDLEISSQNLNLAQIGVQRVQLDYKTLKSLDAKRREAEAKVRYYSQMLSETIIKSPANGKVAKRNTNPGEMAVAGVPLYYILDSENIWIQANIEESKIRKVRPGADVAVNVDAYPNHSFKGKVEFVGPAATSEFSLFPSDNPAGNFIKVAHRIPVRIKVENPEGLLKPGMNVVVDISTR